MQNNSNQKIPPPTEEEKRVITDLIDVECAKLAGDFQKRSLLPCHLAAVCAVMLKSLIENPTAAMILDSYITSSLFQIHRQMQETKKSLIVN